MNTKDGIEASASGTTTADYSNALAMYIAPIKRTSFAIKNTGDTNSMYYKVLIYRNVNGTISEEYGAEASLVAGAQYICDIPETKPHVKAVVQVKSNSGETTYLIEGVQYR